MTSTHTLAGTWQFQEDPSDVGVGESWQTRELAETIALPGTTASREKGRPTSPPDDPHEAFNRPRPRTASASICWYSRFIEVPADWGEKDVEVGFERCQWVSQAWLDGQELGLRDSLATPHRYSLDDALRPGRAQRLTVRMDSRTLPLSLKDSIAEEQIKGLSQALGGFHTSVQSSWNGLLGELVLAARDRVRIEGLHVYPDLGNQAARVRGVVRNTTGGPCSADVEVTIACATEEAGGYAMKRRMEVGDGDTPFEVDVPTPGPRLWDEFSPALYDCTAACTSEAGTNAATLRFGFREISTGEHRLLVNGRPIFMRGALENAVFPLTGHAPMDEAYWEGAFGTARAWGLNHVRFHSWCPPGAAFRAADRLGVYLQVELPNTSCPNAPEPAGDGEWLLKEMRRILETFGNHPSFCLMSVGNEQLPGKPWREIQAAHMEKVAFGQRHDPRRLYTCTSHPYTPGRDDDFYVSAWGVRRGERRLCGIQWGGGDVVSTTRFNTDPPETLTDHASAIAGIPAPTLSHEAGQWSSFPDTRLIERFTGCTRPFNLERIRNHLAEAGLDDRHDLYCRASAALAALLYREDVEAMLRTPNMAGFQLLGLYDSLNQGTATEGLLDHFHKPKAGGVAQAQWRRSCGPAVLLARLARRVWSTDDAFEADLQLVNFSDGALSGVAAEWRLTVDGRTFAAGRTAPVDAPRGGMTDLGRVRQSLGAAAAARHMRLEVEVPAQGLFNDWSIWVYPSIVDDGVDEWEAGRDVGQRDGNSTALVTPAWNEETRRVLRDGGRVLLCARPRDIRSEPEVSRPGQFTTAFWNPVMKNAQPGTYGIWCDPDHPAFGLFPTDYHADWQWADILRGSRACVLDTFGPDLEPLVGVIDGYHSNRRLGSAFELRVGKGRLLFCGMDLNSALSARLSARQLRKSFIRYVERDEFQPTVEAEVSQLDAFFRP